MPNKVTIYRVGGEVAEMDAIDARHTLQRRPDEWFQTAEAAKGATSKKAKPALEAKHRGGGSYSVLDADGKEVLEKLSKDDAEAFNAMSDEEKAEYVKAEAAAKS